MISKLVNTSIAFSLLLVPVAPALAQTTTTPPATNLACMQTAVEKRDNAVIAALDKFHGSMKTALQTRRDALKAAWGISDRKARRDALKAAWEAFKKPRKDAVKMFRDEKRAAWKQFKADAKNCRGEGGEPGGGEGQDLQV